VGVLAGTFAAELDGVAPGRALGRSLRPRQRAVPGTARRGSAPGRAPPAGWRPNPPSGNPHIDDVVLRARRR